MVIARYIDAGETIALPRRRAATPEARHSVEEQALIAFLDRNFPERRREALSRARPAKSRRRRVPERRAAA